VFLCLRSLKKWEWGLEQCTSGEEEAARKFEEGKFYFILREFFFTSSSNYDAALNSAIQSFTKAYDASLLFMSKNEGRVAAVKTLLNRAAALKELKKYRAAIDDCTKVLDMDPLFVHAYIRRARCYVELKEWAEAVHSFNIACQLCPGDKALARECEVASKKI